MSANGKSHPNPDSAVEMADTSNRNSLIQNCASAMLDIKRQRAELNEQAGEIRQRPKDAGVQVAAFNYAVRVAEMEQEAKDDYLDSLRECFGALDVGQTLDWLNIDVAQPEAAAAE